MNFVKRTFLTNFTQTIKPMKLLRPLLIVVLCSLLITELTAQISLSREDFPDAGDTLRYSLSDPLLIDDYLETGEDILWDFSNLEHQSQDLEEYLLTTDIDIILAYFFGNNSYASSVLNLFADENFNPEELGIDEIYQIFNKNESVLSNDGFALITPDFPIPFEYSDIDEMYQFPFNYERHDSTTYFGDIASGDTLYLRRQGSRVNEADGWGTIITPYGEFECLRVKTTLYEDDSLYLESLAEPIVSKRTTKEYKWFAKDEKLPILSVSVLVEEGNKAETPFMVKYRDIYRPDIEPPVADFTTNETDIFVNDTVCFENLSTPEHEANEYLWEFSPDNVVYLESTNSNSIEPIVTFTEEGVYDVSLSVSNASGTDNHTKTAYINVQDAVFVQHPVEESNIIFPNPACNYLNIKSSRAFSKIKIRDITGKNVQIIDTKPGKYFTINTGNLQRGTYIISCFDDGNNIIFNEIFFIEY